MSPRAVVSSCAAALIAAVALSCALPATAGLADRDPAYRVRDFLADCASAANRKSCQARILLVDAEQLTSASCGFLGDIDKDEALKSILAWLSAHSVTKTLSADDGILLAMRSLWKCKL